MSILRSCGWIAAATLLMLGQALAEPKASGPAVFESECSTTISNEVGDEIAVSALLETSDEDDPDEDESLMVTSSGGEFSQILVDYDDTTPLGTFVATQANETVSGSVFAADGDETCTITASPPLFSQDTKRKFYNYAETTETLAELSAGVSIECLIAGEVELCGIPVLVFTGIVELASKDAGYLAGDPPDANFTEVALPVFDTEPDGISGRGGALKKTFQALNQNLKRVIVLDGTTMTTIDRVSGARLAHDKHWEKVQLKALARDKKMLGKAILDEIPLLRKFSNAIKRADSDIRVRPSDIKAAEKHFKHHGLSKDQIAALKKLGADDATLGLILNSLIIQHPTDFHGSYADALVDPALLQSLATLGKRLTQ
ncbi:MAG TPA: hypothetical protein VG889_15780 [Rhizomicrobium sp.]|nr:hypothetical protein [Rhizomicrobium sp.]